ncbi:MAG: bifunctional DNA-formamidopyrimidine glycosylase/DNA-(apurinic or apyrimidinic site) lyase [Planctomycetes bacterium]|nr:bifunctional DNA-formamidopyrimidine glycosylase/DNA-(apurinic or apyrimidinic site) lyase [Planctomycetota bacterium]
MPELPEVETVRAGLERLIGTEARIARIELMRPDLRVRIPPSLGRRLAGQPITGIRRRAKFLLIDTPAGSLLCHFGMTGTWRLAPPGDERPHDHCYLHLADHRRLAFRDPRRFGMLGLVEPHGRHPSLDGLGPEPLDAQQFTLEHLAQRCRRRKAPIKAVIMDQAVVVGVGNIYAQEALFRAGIRPQRPAGAITRARLARLVDEIRLVLAEAIVAGGSTISDFRQAGGDSGYFQHRFRVYGRAGEACVACGARLTGGVVGGRGTTWCRTCQR